MLKGQARVSLSGILTICIICIVPTSNASAQAQFTVLQNFSLTGGDAAGPFGGIAFDAQGNIYGTTGGGGTYGYGAVFELTPNSNGTWSEAILHSFSYYGLDGSVPMSTPLLDAAGNLYGTTLEGGSGQHPYGTVFKMTPSSIGWSFSVLHNFGSTNTDGSSAKTGVVMDALENLYGVASVVFELTPTATAWTESVIDSFANSNDGSGPIYAGVILDSSGNLYGTTQSGGAFSGGVVYALRRAKGGWKPSVPHAFPAFEGDGIRPVNGNLAIDSAGNLYSATFAGGTGTGCVGSCGTVFKLTPTSRGRWKETVLYNFQGASTGFGPAAGVTLDSAGNVYGTTIYGGTTPCACGVVYKLAPNVDGTWTYSILHSFSGTDGNTPFANLTYYNGNFYGTTGSGGTGGGGVVFEITP
jgi:uncharacterized repeat protein (TIGR03803 family)